jgi:hypothetical protein
METDATLTALRLWGYATNVEVVRLWRVEDEALLAEVTITSENGAWVEESVTEVELESGKEYMATCRHPSGNNRTYRRENPATDAVTFSDAVTSIGDCFATDNGMPVANGAGRIAGLADIVFLA